MKQNKKENLYAEAIHEAEQTLERQQATLKAMKKEREEILAGKPEDIVKNQKRLLEIGDEKSGHLLTVKIAEVAKANNDLEAAQKAFRESRIAEHAEILKPWVARINEQLKTEAAFRRELYRVIWNAARDGVKWKRFITLHPSLAREGFDLLGFTGRIPVVYGEGQEGKERYFFEIGAEELRLNDLARKARQKEKAEQTKGQA